MARAPAREADAAWGEGMSTRIKFADLEYRDGPTMNPRNTRQLRRLIEVPRARWLWGKKFIVAPRLVSEVFGNGRRLMEISPLMYRPHFFVVRIDDSWAKSNRDHSGARPVRHWLDDVYGAIVDEFVEWPWAGKYGLRWSDDDSDRSSRIDMSEGCEFFETGWPRLRRRFRKAVTT